MLGSFDHIHMLICAIQTLIIIIIIRMLVICVMIFCNCKSISLLFFSASTADVSQVWPGMDQSFTKEVEDEANSYFQRIYNHPPNPTISIDEVLEMLKKFKDSPVKKERVGTCFTLINIENRHLKHKFKLTVMCKNTIMFLKYYKMYVLST